jgi:hypothetical protein
MRACSDLDKGIAETAALTGVEAKCSGSYQGLGTRNALLSVGTVCYQEIIAPDPDQNLEGNFGGRLKNLTSTGLVSVAMAETDLADLSGRLSMEGFDLSDVLRTTSDTQAGESLVWKLLFVPGVEGAPFYIDWLDCVHPAETSPKGCLLKQLEITVNDELRWMPLLGGSDAKILLKTEPASLRV